MNESKDELIAIAERDGVQIDKRWSAERILAAITAPASDPALLPAAQTGTKEGADDVMNAYALRIWEGQSSSLSLRDRVSRIAAGLRRQGFDDPSGLRLPTTEDIKRFL